MQLTGFRFYGILIFKEDLPIFFLSVLVALATQLLFVAFARVLHHIDFKVFEGMYG